MLLNRETLEGIRAGRISLVFRRWKRPTVRPGGHLKTALGLLAIDSVDPVALESVTAAEAKRAGFSSKAALRQALQGREGRTYRIRLHLAGDDPRKTLREQPLTGVQERASLELRLERMDRAARGGSWTRETLRLISERPGTRAAELAHGLGLETLVLKRRVRRLKELGLTESLEVGYRLSPRGRSLLQG